MAEQPIPQERAEAALDRRIADYWQSMAQQNPGATGVALGNAKDATAAGKAEDNAADRQEGARRRPRLRRS